MNALFDEQQRESLVLTVELCGMIDAIKPRCPIHREPELHAHRWNLEDCMNLILDGGTANRRDCVIAVRMAGLFRRHIIRLSARGFGYE